MTASLNDDDTSAGTFEIVFVSIIWYCIYTVYSFGVASIGLKLFSVVVTGTTLEKSQPDVPPYIID